MLTKLFEESNQTTSAQYSTETLMFALESFDNIQNNFDELSNTLEELEDLEGTVLGLQEAPAVSETELFQVHSRLRNVGDSVGLESITVSL